MRQMIRRWWADLLIFGAWGLSIAAVIGFEQGPLGWTPRMLARTLNSNANVNEQWFGLYYQNQKVGYTHVMVVPDEQDGHPGLSIADHGRLRFSLLGVPQLLDIRSRAFIDSSFTLTNFAAVVEAEHSYRLDLQGRRVGDTVEIKLSTPASSLVRRFRDPAGRLWMSGLASWTTFNRLHVGQRGQMELLNPLALRPEPVYFSVTRKETIDGKPALVVEQDYQGMSATTWVTRDGVVLKETSPMGWELVNEPMKKALEGLAQPVDLLSTTAVPVDRPLTQPATIERLLLLVEGADADAFTVDRRPWQEALPPETLGTVHHEPPRAVSWCVMELRRPRADTGTSPPSAVERYVRPGPFVQSDDPLITRQAAQIVGTETDRWARALRINDWVYRTVTKRFSVGLPTAKDALLSLSGDCHEHTVLFTGLARAAGIPTRMVAGLVFYVDRFYYHAWPEVWIEDGAGGRWVPLDPTLGQTPADATHLGLLEAEGEGLVSLAQFVGQLKLSVLQLERSTPAPATAIGGPGASP